MKKAELIAHMAKEAGITKSAAAKALNSIIEAVHGTLKKNEAIRITDLGTFRALKRNARKGVNPRTGKKISIPAMKVPRFRASKALKKTVLQSK